MYSFKYHVYYTSKASTEQHSVHVSGLELRELLCPPAVTQECGSPSACPCPSPITRPGAALALGREGRGILSPQLPGGFTGLDWELLGTVGPGPSPQRPPGIQPHPSCSAGPWCQALHPWQRYKLGPCWKLPFIALAMMSGFPCSPRAQRSQFQYKINFI